MVCLGSPKQERWMSANAGRLSCGLMAGLGGSLDVLAGNVQRAPEAWRKLGLEWLYPRHQRAQAPGARGQAAAFRTGSGGGGKEKISVWVNS